MNAQSKILTIGVTDQPMFPAPDSSDSDQQLVERAQKGDNRAFDLLVMKYQHKIMGLISRFVPDHSEVQDVAQEAFVKAYRALRNFRGESQFYTWLYRIAINSAKNHLVSRGRRPPSSDVEIDDAEHFEDALSMKDTATPDRLIAKDQLQKVIFQTIESLPEDLKMAITLREMDGLSYEDIAQIMDCPIGTVRSRIFRARDAIDLAMAPLLEKTA